MTDTIVLRILSIVIRTSHYFHTDDRCNDHYLEQNSPEQPEHGVRWGVVCPGATVTPLHDNMEGRLYRSPIGPDGKPLPGGADKSRWLR